MKPYLTRVMNTDMPSSVVSESLEKSNRWPTLQRLPVTMRVRIPLPGISLRGVIQLTVGMVLGSDWPVAEEVPLYAQNVALGWCEFEVVEERIAVRLTRLG